MLSATSTIICAEVAGASILPRYRAVCMSKVLLFIIVISSRAASWSTKSDRAMQAPATKACQSQTWGAWSEDCAAALTGASRVRNVSFVTVEKTAPTVNETILARYPVAN